MLRRPPRSPPIKASAASDVYTRQLLTRPGLQAAVKPMGEGTPFANLLVCGVRSADCPALHEVANIDNRLGGDTRRGIEFTPKPEGAGDG
jgi:hypothetical protein